MVRVYIVAAIFATGCGADTEAVGQGAAFDESGGAKGAATRMPEPAPTAASDCTVGDRRDAQGAELAEAKYCICEASEAVGKVWRCYGPSPDAPRPEAKCAWTFVQPGDAASCFVSWSECSDARVYSLSCVNEFCICLVNGRVGAELEPGTRCPEDLGELNELCGWALRR